MRLHFERPYALKLLQKNNVWIRKKELPGLLCRWLMRMGLPVMISDDEVTCHLSSNARLLGLKRAIIDMSDYTDPMHRYIMANSGLHKIYRQKSGEIMVRFTAPWLVPTETTIEFSRSRP